MVNVGIISLGCPRNLVDSEVMLGLLKEKGYNVVERVDESDVALVNTCAFIREATDESLDTIMDLISLKKEKKIKHIIVAGCLTQRYKAGLKDELKEIDGFIGTGDIPKIDSVLDDILKRSRPFIVGDKPTFVYDHRFKREPLTPSHSAYVKIQEGCANRCSYCVIPEIRGDLRSRPMESILEEVKGLKAAGKTSEINIIGQDTTSYGKDLYGKGRISELLRSIAKLKSAQWIRLLYTHPAHYTKDLMETIRDEDTICKYVDLPLQHINDKILKRMNRKTTSNEIRSLIDSLRREIPGLAIRTTAIVGFPGETDNDFKELFAFVKSMRFERLGVFKYSNEEGSLSYNYREQIPEKIKEERLGRVMELQREISTEYNRDFIGKTIKALVDERSGEDRYLGRTEFDAPSVDGEVHIKGKGLKRGDLVDVTITDTLEYDLVGEVV